MLTQLFAVGCLLYASVVVVSCVRVRDRVNSADSAGNAESCSPCDIFFVFADCDNIVSCAIGYTGQCLPVSPVVSMSRNVRCLECLCVNNRKKSIVCATCNGDFHLTCVGLTREQANVLSRWLCPTCLGRTEPVAQVDLDIDLVEYITLCCADARVIRIVPKGAIFTAADALQELLERAIRDKSRLAWGRLLSFGTRGLAQPVHNTESGRQSVSLTTRIKRQVLDFMQVDRLIAPEVRVNRRKGSSDGDTKLKARVAGKFAEGDLRGAVRLLASTEEIAPRDENTIAALKQKHPSAPDDLELPAPPDVDFPPSFIASEDDVRRAIASFPTGSAGGPDGVRPGHLKTLIARKSAEAGARLLTTLTEFVNLVLRGEVPEFARSVFYGATLCALGKKDGGIRPIAVGSTFRRLATKVGAKALAPEIGSTLRPVQLGFATGGGCEAAAHAARRYLSGAQGRKVLFKVDMANAFNSIRRDVFLSSARERAQGLYRLLWQAYSEPSSLFYGSANLVSATGIQQGDPFGPALFSIGIDQITRGLAADFNVWYLDDGTIGDSPEQVILCVERLIHDLRKVGLEVNQRKCELIILNHTRQEAIRTEELFRGLLPEVKVVPRSEALLLGAPLSEESVSMAVLEKRRDLERLVSRLRLLENHQAFAMLKNCFSLPKLQYILRATTAYKQEDVLARFDETLVAALSTVTNVRFDGDSLVQASLPVRQGGLGIRMSKDIALPAFVSSLHSVCGLIQTILCKVELPDDVELETAVEAWNLKSGEFVLADSVDLCRQTTWDRPLAELAATRLLERSDQISRARLLAAASRESGLWLHALPTPSLGTLLDPDSFRIAVALRVGAEVCESHVCRCGRGMDSLGLHGLSCRYNAGRIPRHSALNDIIKRALQAAGIPAMLEPVGIDRGDGKRPDGITMFPFIGGRCLCWDATCVDTYADTHLYSSAVLAGSAARAAEEKKRRKYAALGVRYRFEPVALETTGVYGDTTGALLSEIGSRLTEATGDRRETLWLEQRVGLAVQRGNACSILAAVRGKYDVCSSMPRT